MQLVTWGHSEIAQRFRCIQGVQPAVDSLQHIRGKRSTVMTIPAEKQGFSRLVTKGFNRKKITGLTVSVQL